MLRKLLHSFLIAIDAISHNKLRAFLTSLGIIFGVASVIAMLAIGKGAEKAILEQMKLLGANNIIITPDVNQKEGEISREDDRMAEKKPFSPGLTMEDASSISDNIPHVLYTSSEIELESMFIRAGLKRTGNLVGVDKYFLENKNFTIAFGNRFSAHHFDNSAPVCIIGDGIRTKFFTGENPIGKRIKCGKNWLTVVGVLKEMNLPGEEIKNLGLRDFNMDIYAPTTTVLLRYENRARISQQDVQEMSSRENENAEESSRDGENSYHQLDKIIVHVDDNQYISSVSEILNRMMQRRHNNVIDYEITIPQLLIEQEQKTKRIFNIVLGAIASISLIVGGIGVMNIMLASVLDRIREIGLRQSIGATRRDITLQFINEAVTITVTGGIVGIILGFLFCFAIESSTDIETIISPASVILSFLVSISVGLIFGIYPAQKAAAQDPVVLLRHD
ncbi:MAG: ABC transporter permease [FCB group bacterium]|nr:ABC transporter permease [FCB group bacterium]